ncbi:MAG: Rieske 2Fe-2S domain-containing protein, partial [Solirubrobacteraceae bacterium]
MSFSQSHCKNNLVSTDSPVKTPPALEALTAVLSDALRALAADGRAEEANRLAGRAYAALRREHPDEARRINALMHELTRISRTTKEQTMPTTDPQLDVRTQPPARRHELIFDTYDKLRPGRGSCCSTTTTPGRSTTSSPPSTPTSSAGTTWRSARRPGACGSAVPRDGRLGADPVLNCAGELFAIENACSHEDTPPADGELAETACSIECPRHGSRFDPRTGRPLNLPANEPIEVFPVEVIDDVV